MANQWYIRKEYEICGPYDSTQLKGLAAKGFVKPTDEVSPSPTVPWTVARKVKGLLPIPQSNTPLSLESNRVVAIKLAQIARQLE